MVEKISNYDVNVIHQLMKKAAENRQYDLAAELRDVRDFMKKKINLEWADELLKRVIESN